MLRPVPGLLEIIEIDDYYDYSEASFNSSVSQEGGPSVGLHLLLSSSSSKLLEFGTSSHKSQPIQ